MIPPSIGLDGQNCIHKEECTKKYSGPLIREAGVSAAGHGMRQIKPVIPDSLPGIEANNQARGNAEGKL
jgi:hypothetical protein